MNGIVTPAFIGREVAGRARFVHFTDWSGDPRPQLRTEWPILVHRLIP